MLSDATRRTFLLTNAAAAAAAAQGPPELKRLAGAWPLAKVSGALVPRANWKPFPTAAERAAWEAAPAAVREAALRDGEAALKGEWPALPATVFLEFRREGNRSRYEGIRNARRNRLRALVLAECFENKGRFADQILNGLWLTCEETYWGVPAHLNLQKAGSGLPDAAEPTVDLFAAETGSLVAWTDYLLAPRLASLSPLLRPRLQSEIERRILDPCFTRSDFWWMGLAANTRAMNNWNPWINSNWLTCALLMERDERRRAETVHKILRSIDRFLDSYHADGGCDEGPGYWGRAGGSLFDCLELLHSASNGAIDVYSMPLVANIGRYIYRVQIHNNWFVNFADASAQVRPAGDLVYRYGKRIKDEDMMAFGAWAADAGLPGESIGRQLPALFNLGELARAAKRQPLPKEVWMPGIEVALARLEAGSPRGLYFAAQGGHNAESHNHNDVGNFVVFAGGHPVLIDVGVETYTAKTFSNQRYDIWTMQSAWHNLPTINGVMQGAGRQFAARNAVFRATDEAAEFRLDLAGAYPKEAAVNSWVRSIRLDRGAGAIEVSEDFRMQAGGGKLELSLVTPCRVDASQAGQLVLASGGGPVRLRYDSALAPKVEEVAVTDGRLRPVWGEKLYRVLLRCPSAPREARWALRITL